MFLFVSCVFYLFQTSLNLSGNFLTVLPYWICTLPQLQHLYLSKNFISLLPDAVANLKRLQTIDISRNVLMYIPEAILDLHELQTMDLSGNSVSSIPTALADMPKIKTLRISRQKHRGATWGRQTVGHLDRAQNNTISNTGSEDIEYDVEDDNASVDSVPTLYVGRHDKDAYGYSGELRMYNGRMNNSVSTTNISKLPNEKTVDVFSYLSDDSSRSPVFL